MTVMIDSTREGLSTGSARAPASGRRTAMPAHRATEQIVMLSQPTSAAAEAVRSLRTHVVAQHLEKGRRALAVCEPTSGSGCSFVAANLAVALAQVGINTLLLEADLRRPVLDKFLQTTGPVTGLRQYLASPDVQLSDVIQSEVLPQLSVLYAGSGGEPGDMAMQELLGGARFRDLMNDCLREFDATIIDTPPANECSDASRVGYIDGHGLRER